MLPLGLVAARETVPLDVGEELGDGAPLEAARVNAEELFGGGVGVEERRVAGHHENALLDGLEDGFHEAALARHAHELRLKALGVEALNPPHELVEEARARRAAGSPASSGTCLPSG